MHCWLNYLIQKSGSIVNEGQSEDAVWKILVSIEEEIGRRHFIVFKKDSDGFLNLAMSEHITFSAQGPTF